MNIISLKCTILGGDFSSLSTIITIPFGSSKLVLASEELILETEELFLEKTRCTTMVPTLLRLLNMPVDI